MEYKQSQIFTPIKYVNMLLNEINYINNLHGKKILENSCGNGAILSVIIERYIKDLSNNGFPTEQIKNGLENDIYAIEIDVEKYNECILKINEVCAKNNIYNVKWNIFNDDSLFFEFNFKFDFIVGNPPYINYRKIDVKNRIKIKEKFKYCSFGRFDYCYAFIEKSVKSLKQNGKMSYLIPSSVFKNVSGKNMRKDLLKYNIKIIDNFDEIIFDDANVSASIMVITCEEDKEEYITVVDYKNNASKVIKKDEIGDKWIFSSLSNQNVTFLFGEKYNVGSTIATLANECYIFIPSKDDDNYYYVGDFKIEKNIVKKACSPKSKYYNREEFIIYPYYYNDNKLIKYTASEFENKFPECVKYLKSKKEILEKRTSDRNSLWFEYGRSQALKYMNVDKLMISIIITNKVNVYELGVNDIPYSGIYITQKENGDSLTKAKNILESDEFYQYINSIGVDSSTKSKRITPDDLKKYKY